MMKSVPDKTTTEGEMQQRQDESKSSMATLVQQELHLASHSGPLPHPDILKGYGDINPTYPERIFLMAEENNRANIENDKAIIKQFGFNQRLGIILAFILGLAGIAGGIICGILGFPVAAIAAILGGVSPVVIASIKSVSQSGRKDNDN